MWGSPFVPDPKAYWWASLPWKLRQAIEAGETVLAWR